VLLELMQTGPKKKKKNLTKVAGGLQAYTLNVLRFQEKGVQIHVFE
jgi:hypothetical protein